MLSIKSIVEVNHMALLNSLIRSSNFHQGKESVGLSESVILIYIYTYTHTHTHTHTYTNTTTCNMDS